MQTNVMIFDEPTSALDFNNSINVYKVLKSLKSDGKTILICSHDPNHILWFCDEVVIFYQGKILSKGKVKEILNQQNINMIYQDNFLISNLSKISFIHPKL